MTGIWGWIKRCIFAPGYTEVRCYYCKINLIAEDERIYEIVQEHLESEKHKERSRGRVGKG